jgi:hypothetical protein
MLFLQCGGCNHALASLGPCVHQGCDSYTKKENMCACLNNANNSASNGSTAGIPTFLFLWSGPTSAARVSLPRRWGPNSSTDRTNTLLHILHRRLPILTIVILWSSGRDVLGGHARAPSAILPVRRIESVIALHACMDVLHVHPKGFCYFCAVLVPFVWLTSSTSARSDEAGTLGICRDGGAEIKYLVLGT